MARRVIWEIEGGELKLVADHPDQAVNEVLTFRVDSSARSLTKTELRSLQAALGRYLKELDDHG